MMDGEYDGRLETECKEVQGVLDSCEGIRGRRLPEILAFRLASFARACRCVDGTYVFTANVDDEGDLVVSYPDGSK